MPTNKVEKTVELLEGLFAATGGEHPPLTEIHLRSETEERLWCQVLVASISRGAMSPQLADSAVRLFRARTERHADVDF